MVCVPLALTSWRSAANLACLSLSSKLSWTYLVLFAAGVITSILNHSLTNSAIMWIDRGLMIFIVSYVMVPLVLNWTPLHLVHV